MGAECKMSERQALIQRKACALVIQHGYDGFTMSDLAQAVGVSRRTLFNAVPDKASAVLGPQEDPAELTDRPEVRQFLAGGPSGDLLDDSITLLRGAFPASADAGAVRGQRQVADSAMRADPKVRALAMERAARTTSLITQLTCQRMGWPDGDLRARAVTASLTSLAELAMSELVARSHVTSVAAIADEVIAAYLAVARPQTSRPAE